MKQANIFITNGGSEALTFAVMALCDPDDEIMVLNRFTPTIQLLPASSALKLTP